MTDYLQPVSRRWTIVGGVASGIAAALFFVGAAMMWSIVFSDSAMRGSTKPPLPAAVVLTALGWIAGYIPYRLIRSRSRQTDCTTLPVWFLQGFGILLLIGTLFAAYQGDDPLLLVKGLPLSFAMIFIGRHIEQRKRSKAGEPGATDNPDDAQRL